VYRIPQPSDKSLSRNVKLLNVFEKWRSLIKTTFDELMGLLGGCTNEKPRQSNGLAGWWGLDCCVANYLRRLRLGLGKIVL